MLEFKRLLIEMSERYPFISKIVISPDTWGEITSDIEKLSGEEQGTISSRFDHFYFGNIRLEKDNEK